MSYYKTKINVVGNEMEFMKAVVGFFTSIDGVTCETDMDNFLSDDSTIPTIKINPNNPSGAYILLNRNYVRNSDINRYTIQLVEKDGTIYGGIDCYFFNNTYSYSQKAARISSFAVFKNDNVFWLKCADYDEEITSNSRNLCILHDENVNLVSISTSKNVFLDSLSSVNESNHHSRYTLHDRLNYSAEVDKVEIIKNKMIVSGTLKYAVSTNIFDCSTITENSVIEIDGTKYFAITPNTLTKYN